jgi:3-oxoacyl-[acyl-carrier protein] reductase
LSGKVAAITGASSGIGEATALALAGAGAAVSLAARRTDRIEELARRIESDGGRALAVPTDVTKEEEARAFVERTNEELGRLDILVNNAGLTRDNLFMVMKDEQWDEVIAVNLTSTFMLCRAAARAMLRAKPNFGRIINIASVSGVFGNPGQGNYSASKAGVIGMTKSLAREVAPRGITANCIAPGFVSTPMTAALNEKQTEEIAKMIPQQRFGAPEEIAAGVVYLASNEAGYITGQTLHINGGMAMV